MRARKLSCMVYWDEFSTYFHACPSVKVVEIHDLLKIELSKEKMNDEKLCPLCCRYCTSGLPSDITVVVGEQSFHLHKVNFHQNHSQLFLSFVPFSIASHHLCN